MLRTHVGREDGRRRELLRSNQCRFVDGILIPETVAPALHGSQGEHREDSG